MGHRPKRRKYKDNPYTLSYGENSKYIITFKDSKGVIQKVEVTKKIFNVFDRFELDDLKELNEYDNHIEHKEIFENDLYQYLSDTYQQVDIIVEKKMARDKLNESINKLPEIQKRRLKKYFFEDKTYEEIAAEENCTKRAVKFSIDIALEKLSKKLKK